MHQEFIDALVNATRTGRYFGSCAFNSRIYNPLSIVERQLEGKIEQEAAEKRFRLLLEYNQAVDILSAFKSPPDTPRYKDGQAKLAALLAEHEEVKAENDQLQTK